MARSRSSRKRAEMTPVAARGVGWMFGVISLLAAAGVWWMAVVDSHQRSRLEAFEAAPLCAVAGRSLAADVTASIDTSCRAVLPAEVAYSFVHTGGKGGGGYTSVGLGPTEGGGQITARYTGRKRLETGEPVTITVWHGNVALIQPTAPASGAFETLASPQYGVGNEATGILVLMAFVLGVGTASWGFATYYLMRRRRAAPVHVAAAVMFAVVVALRVRSDYGALTTVAYAWPPVFAALIAGWLLMLRSRVRAESAIS